MSTSPRPIETERLRALVASLKRLIDLDETNGDARETPENQLGAPAGEADIVAVEAAFGVRLPEDYRAFLSLHDGWSGFRYEDHLLSTRQLLDREIPDPTMLEDYALSDDPVPRAGIPVLAGFGRRFLLYEVRDSRAEGLVSYDLGPGERFPTFLEYLESEKVALEKSLKEAMISF